MPGCRVESAHARNSIARDMQSPARPALRPVFHAVVPYFLGQHAGALPMLAGALGRCCPSEHIARTRLAWRQTACDAVLLSLVGASTTMFNHQGAANHQGAVNTCNMRL